MRGLVRKDILILMKSINITHFFVLLMPLIAIANNPQMALPVVAFVVAFVFASQIITTISLDEICYWRKYVTALPIPIFMEVLSKYVLSFILAGMASIFILIIGIVLNQLNFAPFNIVITFSIAVFFLVALYNAITIPAAFKFGSSATKYFVLVFAPISVIVSSNPDFIISILDLNKVMVFSLIAIVTIIILLVSFMITVRILSNK